MIFLKYLSGVANLLQKYLLKCYFWNIWAVWPIYCRNICCDNIFEIFELCDQNPAGHERSVQLKQKIEIKSRYKKNMMQETISLPRAWTGRSTQMEGTQTELSTTSTQGCSGFLAHFPSYFVWKCICIMMYFYHLPNSTKRSTNGEKAMLSWLDIHMVLIPINPNGRPHPFPRHLHISVRRTKVHIAKLCFENCAKTTFFKGPGPKSHFHSRYIQVRLIYISAYLEQC